MSLLKSGAVALVGLMFIGAAAQANPIGYTGATKAVGGTDVAAQNVDINYDATTGALTATGSDFQFNGANPLANTGDFSLTVYLTAAGAIDSTKLASDSLSVLGGSSSSNVLFSSTDLQAFGYDDATGTPMHLLFGPGGGQYGSTGPIGVNLTGILTGFTGFTSDFGTQKFAGLASGNADTLNAVPLPSAAWMGLGLIALLPLAKRSRANT